MSITSEKLQLSDQMRATFREAMPVSQRYAYFDHAAVGPLPTDAAEAVVDYARTAQQHGDVHWLKWAAGVKHLRSTAAEFIGATADEITLVANTTQGLNIVAESLPWKAGDNVVLPGNEFPSNYLPWKNLERLGVEVRTLPVPSSGRVDCDLFQSAIDAKTRLVTLSWVGFSSGYRVDLAKLVDLVHERGSLIMVDAIQGLGVFPLDVNQCPVDFLCADGHKWMLGPEGAGMLYIRQQHLDLLRPYGLGWGSLEVGAFEPGATRLKTTAAKYEGGSANMAGLLGFGASLDLLAELGAGRCPSLIAAAVLENVALVSERLRQAGMQPHVAAEPEHRSGIVGVEWDTQTAPELEYAAAREHCLRAGVVTSVRGGRLRVSTHAYNDASDIDRLVAALQDFRHQQRTA